MTEQPMDLTADEIRILTDAIQNTDKEDGCEVAKPLLLKLGSAFLEMIPPDGPKLGTTTIWVTEPQAWLIRAKLNSGLRTDRESKLGLLCLRKVYTILLAFDAAEKVGDALDAEDGDQEFHKNRNELTWRPGEFGWGMAPVENWDEE